LQVANPNNTIMLQKTKLELTFNSKRDFKLITPCCGRNNTDGKFINYKNLSQEYGYCHSCGKASLPPTTYTDENGSEYIWNELENKFQTDFIPTTNSIVNLPKITAQKFIDESIIWKYFKINPENNLLQYLRKTYGDLKTEDAKETYSLGTSNDGGILFWSINSNLGLLAKTLYDYWFVQFDFPDANGKPYKTSGGKMVWNEELKREIPLDWEVKTLLDIATFTNGLACQKFRPNENEEFYRVIKIREMGTGFTENSEFVSLNIPEKVVVYNGDILFSWSATLDVKIWTGGTGGLNQHIFKVTSKNYPNSYYYFELLNYLQHFKMMAELRKTTMGHITQDHLRESRITIPPKGLINELDKVLNPILEKKVKLDIENQEFASLRDWLLPMLMNGQVKVQD